MTNTNLCLAERKVYEQKKGFSAKVGENIGYERGAKMIKNYVDQNHEEVMGHFMGRNIIEAILAQPGVVGITMFYGLNELGLAKPIMVGVDSKGDYILNITTVGANGEMIKEKGIVATGVISGGSTPPPPETPWW
jgi:hypothetical protein